MNGAREVGPTADDVCRFGALPRSFFCCTNTLASIFALNGGTNWKDVEDLLMSEFGAEAYEGSGSAVTFVIKGMKLTVDRPHPRRECGKGLVKRVRAFLEEIGTTGKAD